MMELAVAVGLEIPSHNDSVAKAFSLAFGRGLMRPGRPSLPELILKEKTTTSPEKVNCEQHDKEQR